ncbi:labd-13Z-ene-9,15,16-triol synthase, chloroplastic-like [Salvia miltiorrhiza]|uniref:labd-13Z-ene-9,15,16-triol synthase, chloroplastic-like n=1 Tax=Salvia miltiorrhiza TaxID=226208 RepID=UPI0025ABC909|nr:labd-13Z-ene-9,15,16-triol synthase, chloroplastic-like [Salvia miltiorrhiza]
MLFPYKKTYYPSILQQNKTHLGLEMDPVMLGSCVLLALLTSILWYKWNRGGKTLPLPPGPRGVPILGYLPFMGADMLQHLTHLSHHYGPIYKLRLGSRLAVVITSPSLLKQVVRDQDHIFAYRDATVAALTYSRGARDVVFSPPNSSWRAMRKVLVSETQSGSSLHASRELRKDQIRKAVRSIYSKIGRPVAYGELAFQTEVSLLMNLMWGGVDSDSAGELERERLGTQFRALTSSLNYLLGKPNVSDLFPLLSRFDLQGVKKQMGKVVDSIDNILDHFISQHEKLSGAFNSEGRKDFLQIVLEHKEKKDSDLPTLSRDQIKTLLIEIIIGGSETSATTVDFAMSELLNRPEAMEKVQKELSEVVGMNNIVEESHLPKLHFLDAVIKETLRLHPPVPFLVPRAPLHSSSVGGYTIPKGTKILLNVWAIHRDPSIWDNPEEFRPERFLEDSRNLNFKGNDFELIPFGSGRRMCPGIPLAERMVAYLLASFLHSFDWKLTDGKKLDMSVTLGIVLQKTSSSIAIPTPRLSNDNLYM